MGGIIGGIEHARDAVDPRRVVGVLHETAGRIERLWQAFIGLDLGGYEIGAIAGHQAGPSGVAAAGFVAGQDAVADVEHMARPVGIDDVEAGDLHAFQCGFETGEILRLAHIEIGLQHARAIEAGDADGDGISADIEHRAVDAAALHEGFTLQAAIGLADEQAFGAALEGQALAVHHIGIAGQFQLVPGGAQHVVDRVGEAQIVVEGKAQHRQADLCRAIDSIARRADLRFVIGEQRGRPRQMRIGEQHRRAAFRA